MCVQQRCGIINCKSKIQARKENLQKLKKKKGERKSAKVS
jgi:hypothetical protein